MKNLLALAAFVALLVVAVGYFCGWYRIHSDPAPEGQNRVTIDINAQKVKQDVDQAKEKVKDILNNKKDEPKQSSSTPPSSGTPTPPPLPPGIDLTTEVPSLPPIPAAPPGGSIPAAPPSGNYGLPPAPPNSPSGPPALPGQPKSEEFYNFPPPAPPQN